MTMAAAMITAMTTAAGGGGGGNDNGMILPGGRTIVTWYNWADRNDPPAVSKTVSLSWKQCAPSTSPFKTAFIAQLLAHHPGLPGSFFDLLRRAGADPVFNA
jgi:hypothetical protein